MQIIVYSVPLCGYCMMLKAFLKEKKIRFIEKDVSKNKAAALEMVEKSGDFAVPQIEINGKIIVGFEPTAIEAELNAN